MAERLSHNYDLKPNHEYEINIINYPNISPFFHTQNSQVTKKIQNLKTKSRIYGLQSFVGHYISRVADEEALLTTQGMDINPINTTKTHIH